jgi:hypothetical protein
MNHRAADRVCDERAALVLCKDQRCGESAPTEFVFTAPHSCILHAAGDTESQARRKKMKWLAAIPDR